MEDGLEVIVGRSGGCVTVAARGEVDVATVDRFRRVLRDAVYEAEEEVHLDLLEVTFMGSVGINTLVGARRFAIEEGVVLKIVKSSRSVERVLDVMNLTEFFV
jgi:anti-anti-sigma factor